MAISKLACKTISSPNYTKVANKKISCIVIHHMAGNLSIETCGDIFKNPSRKASANYGIGSDGRIACYVDECNRAWTTGNYDIDAKSVTIEVANCKGAPNWEVSDAALQALINLCVDICERNGIKKLEYTGDKKGNLHMHCWYQATACPGPYLKSKFSYIADQVNTALSFDIQPVMDKVVKKEEQVVAAPKEASGTPYMVKVTCNCLNIRASYTTNSKVVGTIKDHGTYTIVEEHGKWGKLKSGAGWIYLQGYTKRV